MIVGVAARVRRDGKAVVANLGDRVHPDRSSADRAGMTDRADRAGREAVPIVQADRIIHRAEIAAVRAGTSDANHAHRNRCRR